MRDWSLAIPSYRRAGLVNERTLRAAADAGVPRERVFLFVCADEYEDYLAAVDPGLVGEIVPESPPATHAGARNAIVDHFGSGLVVQMDDDMRGLVERVDDKTLRQVEDYPALFDLGFDLTEKHNATMWGVYPVRNPYFMKDRVRTGLCLLLGGCYGQNLSGRKCERVSLDVKTDYELSLQHFMADGVLVRMEWVTCDTSVYTGSGGLIGLRDETNSQAAIDTLMSRYPGLVKTKKAKTGFPECRLVAPRT